ncbi:MAG: putative T7SS-secreted protein [Pseudonocardiaceae bacterium]
MSVETALGYPALKYPALGFNPAPGATERVGSLAADLGLVATELGAAHQALAGIGRSSGIWQGEAAQAFHDKLGELPDYLDKAHRSLGDATQVLNQWSADLASMQTAAAQYEAEAAQALQHLRAAESNPDLGLTDQVFVDDTTLAQAQARYSAAISQVTNATKELEEIQELARRLLAQHEELVSDVVNALRRAKDEAPKEPSLLHQALDKLSEFVHGVERVWQWVKDHAQLIAQFGDLMSKISAVLGVLAIITAPFEPVGAIFAGAAAMTSLMALGAHGLAKTAGADVGWGSMVNDAIGALPFIKGALGGAKVTTGAERALRVTPGEVRGYTASRAAKLGVKEETATGWHAEKTIGLIKSEGALGHLRTGFEQAYQDVREGEWLGTKMLNPIIENSRIIQKLGGTAIDPLSVGGRTLNASLKVGVEVGMEVYHHLTGSDGPPPSASATFYSRVAARGVA